MKSYAAFFAALADESRLRLLHLMRKGEMCVCYLQGTLKTNQPKISRHLAYLRRAGLVEARREGKWMYYRLKKLPPPLEELLSGAMDTIRDEPQIKQDNERVKKIQCSPSRFGFNAPERGTKVQGLTS